MQAAIAGGTATLQSGAVAAILTAVELLAKDTCTSSPDVRDPLRNSSHMHMHAECTVVCAYTVRIHSTIYISAVGAVPTVSMQLHVSVQCTDCSMVYVYFWYNKH